MSKPLIFSLQKFFHTHQFDFDRGKQGKTPFFVKVSNTNCTIKKQTGEQRLFYNQEALANQSIGFIAFMPLSNACLLTANNTSFFPFNNVRSCSKICLAGNNLFIDK